MPPVEQLVTYRQRSLQYDGTNSAAMLAFVEDGQPYGWGSNTWSIGSESAGVLVIASSNPDVWRDYTLNTGDHLVMPAGDPVPDSLYARAYTVLA
jgi:hypothetical protein